MFPTFPPQDSGGGTLIGSRFLISPTGPYNFGNVVIGTSGRIPVTISNKGDSGLVTVSSIVFSNLAFTSDAVMPFSLAKGQHKLLNLILTPAAAGPYNSSITVNYTDDTPSSSYSSTLSGAGFYATSVGGILQFNPLLLNFPDTPVLKSSTPLGVVISNVGTGPFNILSTALGAGVNFSLAGLSTPLVEAIYIPTKRRFGRVGVYRMYTSSVTPQLGVSYQRKRPKNYSAPIPFRKGDFPIMIPPGGSIVVFITFTPTVLGLLTDVLNVFTNIGSNPYQLDIQGIGVLLVPAQIVSNTSRSVIIGFSATPPAHFQISSSNFNSEQPSLFTPNGAMWGLKEEKTLTRLELWYENLGVCQLTVTFKAWRPIVGADSYDSKTSAVQTLGTVAADGTERSIIVDVPAGGVTGEIVEFTLNRAALAGPLVVTQFKPYFAKRGEKVEGT